MFVIEREYEHVRCACGGVIGCYNRNNFKCDKCYTEYELFTLIYDHLEINDKTGWIFPMKRKKDRYVGDGDLKQRVIHKARKLGCEGNECSISYGGHTYLVRFEDDTVIRQSEYK